MSCEWYAVFSKPLKESYVVHYLMGKGIEVYYPMVRVRKSEYKSFFPRYLFVHTDLQAIGTSALKWIPGSVGLVAFDGIPAVVPQHFIEALRHKLKDFNASDSHRLKDLKQGDHVVIIDGPFAGYEAVFDMRLSASDRVQVLLHWLGREMKTSLSVNAIERSRRAR